jgi:hypothetical protein
LVYIRLGENVVWYFLMSYMLSWSKWQMYCSFSIFPSSILCEVNIWSVDELFVHLSHICMINIYCKWKVDGIVWWSSMLKDSLSVEGTVLEEKINCLYMNTCHEWIQGNHNMPLLHTVDCFTLCAQNIT